MRLDYVTHDGKSLTHAIIVSLSFPLADAFAIFRRTIFVSLKNSRVSAKRIGVTNHAIDQFI